MKNKKLYAMLVVVALIAGVFSYGLMDNDTPYIYPGAEDFFKAAFLTVPSRQYQNVAEVAATRGNRAAQQYANIVNYYYDTGNEVFGVARALISDPWGEYTATETPR